MKNGSHVHVETADCMVMFKKAQRDAYREKITEKTSAAGWKGKESLSAHHMLFEVQKSDEPEQSEASTRVDSDDEMFNLDW